MHEHTTEGGGEKREKTTRLDLHDDFCVTFVGAPPSVSNEVTKRDDDDHGQHTSKKQSKTCEGKKKQKKTKTTAKDNDVSNGETVWCEQKCTTSAFSHIPSSKQEITRAGKSTLLPSTFPSSWFMKELVPFRERDQRVKRRGNGGERKEKGQQ